LKPGIVEPEETAVARQQLTKHVPAETNKRVTREKLLSAAFSTRFVSMERKKEKISSTTSRVKAGSTSTVTLRVVGGDKKGRHESEAVKCGQVWTVDCKEPLWGTFEREN
jgi:hypothetical protein